MYLDIYKTWLNSEKISEEDRKELASLTDEKDIEYRFGKNVEFGTAGMRGLIGLGTNMLNVYTVRRATQALADYIKSLGEGAMKRGVVISYDTRRMSDEFAYTSALVLATNGIRVWVFPEVHPVPMLSYAVRELGTIAGIMITASHNPKEYNGYKVYGEDGAQMSPEATAKIVGYIDKIGDCTSDKILIDDDCEDKVRFVPKRVDRKYYRTIRKLALSPKEVKQVGKTVKLVYTPVHGSGYVPVTTILKKLGIRIFEVPEQVKPDTEFSTVEVPNPEYKETLTRAIKKAEMEQAGVVFGTDPDCDRLGVAIKDDKGEFKVLSGNQTGVLLMDYVLRRLKETGKLDAKGFVVKSFVTTGMAKLIADKYGVELFETGVGFKFIGEKIKLLDDTGKRKYVFGFEESCGYLRGTHCRDKDAVVASMLFAEMVCYYACHGITVYQRLEELYAEYGFVYDANESKTFGGLTAMQDMVAVVDKLKKEDVKELGGIKVTATRDYSAGIKRTAEGETSTLEVPKNNAVYFELENGFVCVRPSGTEPKLKIYYSIKADTEEEAKIVCEGVKASVKALIS